MGEPVRIHKDLYESGRWASMSFASQMANIGSEVSRACNAKNSGNIKRLNNSFDRALDLLDMTIELSSGSRLKELCRLREVMCDFFVGENLYKSDSYLMTHYFDVFAFVK
jgi:hypothetical protein